MNRKSLSAEDRRAVDLILNHGAAHGTGPIPMSAGASQPRLAAATRVLSMLDALPAIEPPGGMAARTMDRIAGASRTVALEPTISAVGLMH